MIAKVGLLMRDDWSWRVRGLQGWLQCLHVVAGSPARHDRCRSRREPVHVSAGSAGDDSIGTRQRKMHGHLSPNGPSIMDLLFDPQVWAAFVTLAAEIVLGIDNIIFIIILANRLPGRRNATGRVAWGCCWRWHAHPAAVVAGLGDAPDGADLSRCWACDLGRDLILFFGGLFLTPRARWRSILARGPEEHTVADAARVEPPIVQIGLPDIIFARLGDYRRGLVDESR